MTTHLEIEFKILLTPTIYQQILTDYQQDIIHEYQQTNYYLMHPTLHKMQYMLRIREKEGRYELTLKEPTEDGNLETNIPLTKKEVKSVFNKQPIRNRIFHTLHLLNIELDDIDMSHTLQTWRTDIRHPLGILSIDKNKYASTTDYELELEVTDNERGKDAFLEIIHRYHLSYKENCPSKIKRLKSTIV